MLMRPKSKFDVVDFIGKMPDDRQTSAIDKALDARAIRISNLSMASREVMADHESGWVCLEVKQGREGTVDNLLTKWNIETLIPWLPPETVIRRGRKLTMPARPLFSGYLLVHCALEAAAMQGLMETKHVLGVLGGGIRPWRVSARVINNIMMLTADDTALFIAKVEPGDSVYVIRGPYVFLEGNVVKVRKGRAKIEFNGNGRKIDIEMPLAYVRKL
jgi:transcriptional antiterminator NusG